MKTLSKEQVLRLHNALLETFGGTAGIRDDGLLESALNAPFATFGGQYLYPSVQAKAAQLGFGLVCNHPFVDGNKRIGAHVMLVFLAINGIELDYTQEELIDIILQIASGRAKAADLLEWIGGFDPAVELSLFGAYAFLLHCPDGCALMDGGK